MKLTYLLALMVGLPLSVNATVSSQLDTFMHADLHVHSVPVRNNVIDKYFSCSFYHVSVTKASGRSKEVAFYPDTIAILPNGNVMSVSLPKNSSRLSELETCLSKRVSTTSQYRLREFHAALNSLYPFMEGANGGGWYQVSEDGVQLISAKTHRGQNHFYVQMKNGHPLQIHVNYETGQY
ncbi:hypothetical protein [Vibrio agarivorans]|uniref:Uncharacterized protein n=1 Tax=Vibrio agarivorans TaxID=153622 RepID=A0ABT7Y7K4_9VIBR|nr:hypothetical protein [Vibrio agarivorans]MDN2483978.1 hypothetical protein [Vibrio agarivorans]